MVVVGSGVAGLCAAVEARAEGARVAVLEADSEIGGASALSVGGCCIVGTPLQEAAGVLDSVELAAADWRAVGGPEADMVWARRYLRDSREAVHDWCGRLGVEWTELRGFEGNSVPRWHLPRDGGPGVMKPLLDRLETAGVEILAGARVLDVRPHRGRFRIASTRGEWDASAVVVATGGFAANPRMIRENAPRIAALPFFLCGGGDTAIGDGHALLADLGSEFCGLDRLWVYPVGTPSHLKPAPRGLVVRGVDEEIWLNANGARFHDEDHRGGASGTPALLAQPGATAWGVFDSLTAAALLLLDDGEVGGPMVTDPDQAEVFWRHAPCAWRAPTLSELAEQAGLPVRPTVESVARFNRGVEEGNDEFGRPTDTLRTIEHPPFHAIRYLPLVQKTFGGARTDLACRALGAPAGIFAAGEVAGMAGGGINGVGALEGTMFGPCIYSGRIAGRSSARFAAEVPQGP